MTENEVFEHISNLAGDYKCFDEKISHQESLMLCNLIEEIQQCRAIGTVEDIQEVMALCKSLQETVCRYMNIGTIEEFKALKEKIAKIEFILNEKNYIKADECDYGNYYTCENALMIKDIEEIING